MAFNPFDVFRRNQRILFAMLTVFIMFMFTLSFGQGDFFSWLPKWLGTKRGGGELLATIDGAKVRESEVDEVNRRRVLANQYMARAAQSSITALERYVKEATPRVSAENRQTLTAATQLNQMLPMLAQRGGRLTPEMLAQFEQFLRINETLGRLRAITTAKNPKGEDRDVAQAAIYLITTTINLLSSPGGLYFGNQPNANTQDRLDFLLWLKKADKLGVTFVDADTDELVNHEFHRKVNPDDLRLAIEDLRKKPGFTVETLKSALADEFRVRAAQAAVMGQGFSLSANGGVGFAAPYDYFRFYQDQCATARFGVVSVPAENYLAKAAALPAPSEQELRDLFTKAKSVEPNPFNPVIGLKEPRRLKLDWLEVTGTEPFYKSAAEDALKKLTAAGRVSGLLIAPVPGVGATALVVGAAPLATGDPVLAAAYANYRTRATEKMTGDYLDRAANRWSTVYVADASIVRPQNLAAAVGAAFGSQFTGGSLLSAPLALEQSAAVYDRQERAKGLATLLTPSLFAADRIGAAGVFFAARLPQPLPLAVVRPQLEADVAKGLAKQVTTADLKKFAEELEKLGAKPEKAEATAFAAKFAKDRGLKSGGSTRFDDQFSMGDDPGLAPLKDKLAGPHGAFGSSLQFGRRFFFADDRNGPPVATTKMFAPEPYPIKDLSAWFGSDPVFMVWRSAEQPAETPRDFNTAGVKAKAEAAWRRMKAREFAKQAAEELAKKTEKLGDSFSVVYPKLSDIHLGFMNSFPKGDDQARVRYFEIDRVAPLVAEPSLMPGRSGAVAPFDLKPSHNVPYPSPKMSDELVKAKDQPVSTTLVLRDAPEDNFYVAVLLNRESLSPRDFEAIYPTSASGDLAAIVSGKHQEELRKATRDAALALLRAEFRYEVKNADKVNAKNDTSFAD